MDHLKTYYSLENHLAETAKNNPQFKILNVIWELNKQSINSALTNITQYYPHYSIHDSSHSKTIINNIELFLGEERIRNLSPTDTWLLLMAAFTHDLGMVVFYEVMESEWPSRNFQEFLSDNIESEDTELRSAADTILKVQQTFRENGTITENSQKISPIQIKDSVVLLVAEYIRKIHHKRSSDVLKGIDQAFFKVANSFYSDQIPNRLLTILGEVAYLHGVEFYDILKRLEFEANGISNDKIHPRFIAAMLRLGDLLDIDDKRFNAFTERVFNAPQSSKDHKLKHASVTHLLISPDAIEITSDCPNESVYRLTRGWYDALEIEVENQSKEWSNIAPKDLGGSSPQIPKGKIRVYYQGSQADDELLNLRFQVSNEKIFEILEGGSIYDKAEFTFIRELVQNALDASKIQLWKDISGGIYDFAIKEKFDVPAATHQELISMIKFPNDIPDLIYKSYEVKLTVDWEDKVNRNLQFVVEDRGTGISNTDLIRMTHKVGESRKRENGYKEFIETMPFWLRPTGAFGVGLQSLFIVTDSFKIQTKAEGEDSKEIIFRSAKRRKYSSMTDGKPLMQRGTKVIVTIPANRFGDVFGTSFSWDIIGAYDYFTDEHKSIYVPKIRKYIDEILSSVGFLNVKFFGENLSQQKEEINRHTVYFPWRVSESANVTLRLIYEDHELHFEFFESIIGSQFALLFPSNIMHDVKGRWTFYKAIFMVRDIPVNDNLIYYYRLPYSRLTWNFMSPESDKILSLTREKLVSSTKQKLVNKFFEKVVPEAITLAETYFLDNISEIQRLFEGVTEKLALIYLKLILTKRLNVKEDNHIKTEILGEVKFPMEFASYVSNKQVLLRDFLNSDRIAVVSTEQDQFSSSSTRAMKEKLAKEVLTNSKAKLIVIWNTEMFASSLIENYVVKEIALFEEGQVMILERGTSSYEEVKILKGKSIYLRRMINSRAVQQRALYYAAEEYADILAVRNSYASGFEHFPFLSSSSIISPFKDSKSFTLLIDEIKAIHENIDSQKLNHFLSKGVLRRYVTKTLIDWILENRSNTTKTVTEDDVLQAYKTLIIDMLLVNHIGTTENTTQKDTAKPKKPKRKN